jgi:hypothetical protein
MSRSGSALVLLWDTVMPDSPLCEDGYWPIFIGKRWVWVRPPLLFFAEDVSFEKEEQESVG